MPAPITRAVEPGAGEARFKEWMATESGSKRAAASNETLSGILDLQSVTSSSFLCENDLLMAPNSRMIYPFLKSSLKMGHTLCTTPESHLLAKIISSFPANGTLPTGNANLKGDSISNLESIDLSPNAYHYSRRLMAKRQRSTSTEVAVGKLLVVAHVTATDAGTLDLNLELPCRRFLDTSGFLTIGQKLYRSMQSKGFLLLSAGRASHAGPRR